MFFAAIFTIARINNLTFHQQINGRIKYGRYIQQTIISIKKEGNPAICKNMDGPEGYYAKGNKPVTEEQIRHDSIYMRNIK